MLGAVTVPEAVSPAELEGFMGNHGCTVAEYNDQVEVIDGNGRLSRVILKGQAVWVESRVLNVVTR